MATVVKAPETMSARTGLNLHRLTTKPYLTMIDADILPEGPPVKLLAGLLVEKMTGYPPHNSGVVTFAERIRLLIAEGCHVREEKPIDLDAWSHPEPDIIVTRGTPEDYRKREPNPKEVALIIEVADSSYDTDRGETWRRYAAAKVSAYGILNIQACRSSFMAGRSARARRPSIADRQTTTKPRTSRLSSTAGNSAGSR